MDHEPPPFDLDVRSLLASLRAPAGPSPFRIASRRIFRAAARERDPLASSLLGSVGSMVAAAAHLGHVVQDFIGAMSPEQISAACAAVGVNAEVVNVSSVPGRGTRPAKGTPGQGSAPTRKVIDARDRFGAKRPKAPPPTEPPPDQDA